jgi:hypothetical protein
MNTPERPDAVCKCGHLITDHERWRLADATGGMCLVESKIFAPSTVALSGHYDDIFCPCSQFEEAPAPEWGVFP